MALRCRYSTNFKSTHSSDGQLPVGAVAPSRPAAEWQEPLRLDDRHPAESVGVDGEHVLIDLLAALAVGAAPELAVRTEDVDAADAGGDDRPHQAIDLLPAIGRKAAVELSVAGEHVQF